MITKLVANYYIYCNIWGLFNIDFPMHLVTMYIRVIQTLYICTINLTE